MNDLITRLGNFLTNVVPKTAAISLPGVLGALVLAFVIWPPTPHDQIACVTNLAEVEDFNGVTRTEDPVIGCAADRKVAAGFSLSATPISPATIDSGDKAVTVKYQVSINEQKPSSGTVDLAIISTLPANAKATLDKKQISPTSGPAVLSISVPPNTQAGAYRITIEGTIGAITRTVSAPLTIRESGKPDSIATRLLQSRPRGSSQLSGVCQFSMRSLAALEERPDAGTADKKVAEAKLSGGNNLSSDVRKQTAFENQEVLDGAYREMQECIRLESSHVGEEGNEIDKLNYEIGIEEKERDALQAQFLGYQKSGSNLAGDYSRKFGTAQAKIVDDKNQIIVNQQDLRERQAHIDLESDFSKEINLRLMDTGRIRPALSFDDYFSGLGSHLLAIALLALSVGLVLDPVNTAIFGAIFDGFFLSIWNSVRRRRPAVYRIKGKMSDGLRATRTGPAFLVGEVYGKLRSEQVGADRDRSTHMRQVRDPLATYSLSDPFMIPVDVQVPKAQKNSGADTNPAATGS
jgi:hypothetical protein